ncbi:SCP2 sterol-binding domain-containing protein [Propionivibrio sp.]|uniref:ubiquinone biosynthesis accessory factor UbiJ n=1 Tax=Propionivibrio sp. TaxID=2212460 RepID=UPI00261FBB9C|nr:SCP2 sterol-binding domain-containing protein [Propionivibrio sp.]
MLVAAALGLVNHLLAGEDWARGRLKPFVGQTARLELGALSWQMTIGSTGLFVASDNNATADVTITLPADAPLRAMTDRPSLFAATRISGAAELAESLGFVFRNLSWDVESDLAQLVGDIVARRLVSGGRQLAAWHQQQAKNLALNLAEYFTEENPTIARRQDVSDFCAETSGLQEALARLETRVALLER